MYKTISNDNHVVYVIPNLEPVTFSNTKENLEEKLEKLKEAKQLCFFVENKNKDKTIPLFVIFDNDEYYLLSDKAFIKGSTAIILTLSNIEIDEIEGFINQFNPDKFIQFYLEKVEEMLNSDFDVINEYASIISGYKKSGDSFEPFEIGVKIDRHSVILKKTKCDKDEIITKFYYKGKNLDLQKSLNTFKENLKDNLTDIFAAWGCIYKI